MRISDWSSDVCSSDLEDRLLTRVLIALDHQAPLRYKQIAVRIQGFAAAFAVNYHHDDRRQTFAEMSLHKLPQMWIEAQGKLRADIMATVRYSDIVALHLAKPRIGYSIERARHALTPTLLWHVTLFSAPYVHGLTT